MYVRGWKSRRLNCQNGDQHWVLIALGTLLHEAYQKKKDTQCNEYPMLAVLLKKKGSYF